MGTRLARNLIGSRFDIRPVEVSEAGQARLQADLGLTCLPMEEALEGAEVVVLAVPDTAIGKVASGIIDKLAPGTMVVVLDAAAPFAGHLPERADITYFVTHPCHPPIFNDETEMAAKKDHFGGIAAEVAKTIWAPVMRSHRVTVEQMAILEPGLSETVCASLLVVMSQALDECVKRGVPEQAARDFLLGHMNVLGAVIFKEVDGVFSDACNKAIEFGIPALMRDDWKNVFEPQEIAESIRRIT
ncbi:semialdehyde dehydrogenase [Rhizobium sp. Leaf371]|nr:semialdehyde dehydrogenase [Rhizobium sp. Leaf371]